MDGKHVVSATHSAHKSGTTFMQTLEEDDMSELCMPVTIVHPFIEILNFIEPFFSW